MILNGTGKNYFQQRFKMVHQKQGCLFFSEVRTMKTLKFLILAAVLAAGSKARANDYQWTKVVAGEEITGLRATGMIIPQAGALKNQSALTQGRILSVLKREGDTVKPGDPLFLVNDAECISLAEEMHLAQKNGVQELIDAAQQRQKELGVVVENGQYEIVSLYAGVITHINVSSGSSYNPGDQLANILDMSKLTVELDIAEKYVSDLHRGQRVTFQLASESQKSYTSTIETIVPTIDPNQRTTIVRLRPVRLSTDVNLSELVYGIVQTGATQKILKVPSSALVFSHNQQYVLKGDVKKPVAVPVLVVNETDELSSVRPINPGELVEGDSVVSDGAIYLFNDMNGGGDN
jgi:multidrug efflux pump subunit AcrA (membrane-fusion protein)